MNETLSAPSRFTPTAEFWSYLLKVPKSATLVNISPDPSLAAEAIGRGIHMITITPSEAVNFGWSPTEWPLLLRPGRGQWAAQTIVNARRLGASTIYCGLRQDYRTEIGLQLAKRIYGVFGKDGERLYFVPPVPPDAANRKRQPTLRAIA